MRVLLFTYGSRGDVEPMVGLAVRLRALGAEVRVCAPPDFAELLDGAGMPLTPVGWPIRALATGALTGTAPKTLPEIFAELTGMAYESVASAAEGCAVVLATGSIAAVAGAQTAAEKLGVPYTCVGLYPRFLPSPHHPPPVWPGQQLPSGVTDNRTLWKLNAEHMNVLLGEAVNTQRASAGLPPTNNVRDQVVGDRPWLAADPVLGPWPETPELDVVQTGAWIRRDDRPLPADLEAFLAAGEPPVYVGFGSQPMRGTNMAEVSRAVVEAVRAHDRRVLLSRGWADLDLIDDQGDCFAVGEVNQQALFGRVATVVHHGGAGTTTTAALAGAPQVVVPQAGDQPYWAERAADLGIGAAHDGPTPTFESLSAALKTALIPETAAQAKAVAGKVRTDGATVAATLLLDAVSQQRSPESA
ncbi:MAG: glycosyltransferase [Pseudonocardiaceae bacterium]|nr:glycosyltransferase [Pseudonocardiaceae bacterium]